jgi:hypothetical protein
MAYAEWSPYTVYVVSDIVNYSGANYQALQTNQNVVPTTLAPNWAVYGLLNIVDSNTNATFYPTFVSGVGAAITTLNIDSITTPISLNPSTATITATTFSGNATTATNAANIAITDTNTNSTFYPTFVSASGAGQTLRADVSATPFSFNPSNGNISLATTLKIDTNKTALGLSAGSGQGANATAIGYQAGATGQGASSVAIGDSACQAGQGASCVAIGQNAAKTGIQTVGAIAIGYGAGAGTTSAQDTSAIAIGRDAAAVAQGGYSIAIGDSAGTRQGFSAIAVGLLAGGSGTQSVNAVAVGENAGYVSQGARAVAVGKDAGRGTISAQGADSVAIGALAGRSVAVANSIILNGSGADLPAAQAGFFVNPIRNVSQTDGLFYNTATREITYSAAGATKAYVYLIGPLGGPTNVAYVGPTLMFNTGTLAVKAGETSGLTNSGTNGWSPSGGYGRFYSPTATKWQVILTIYSGFAIPFGYADLFLYLYNSGGGLILQRQMYITFSAITTVITYVANIQMGAGDYIVFGPDTGTLSTNFWENRQTTLQFQEI